jgi:hypothetical protein
MVVIVLLIGVLVVSAVELSCIAHERGAAREAEEPSLFTDSIAPEPPSVSEIDDPPAFPGVTLTR